MENSDETTTSIRELNDKLRGMGQGGMITITRGIKALGFEAAVRIVSAVAAFKEFSEDNDPHGEHDCAALAVDGTEVLWKIDYYDLNLEYHSPDAADAKVTRRVLTIMRAEEY